MPIEVRDLSLRARRVSVSVHPPEWKEYIIIDTDDELPFSTQPAYA